MEVLVQILAAAVLGTVRREHAAGHLLKEGVEAETALRGERVRGSHQPDPMTGPAIPW
ncbi:hypothetical protein ACPESR_28980 [Nocardia testacea]|uniref:hypothetical protein n=1 Tax=Nocardia testacea TaxID=248551 RepID=UPI003C30BD1A